MRLLPALPLLAALAAPALAQTADPHAGHTMPAATADAAPSTVENMAAMDKMHRDMAIDYTGDADVDFVRGMIPHHQGAIDMARILLTHGDDPALRTLAEAIIAAQEAEIATMEAWLAANAP